MNELRAVCIYLSEETHTAIPFWLSLPLTELRAWYDEKVSLNHARAERLKR